MQIMLESFNNWSDSLLDGLQSYFS